MNSREKSPLVALFGYRTCFDPRLPPGEKQTLILIFRVTHSPSLRSGERPSGYVQVFPIAFVLVVKNHDHRLNSRVCGSGRGYTSPSTTKCPVVRVVASETSDQSDREWWGPAVR